MESLIRIIKTDNEKISVERSEEGELVIHREGKTFVISDLGERIVGHSHLIQFIEKLTDQQCSYISIGDELQSREKRIPQDIRTALIKIAQGIPL
jgi:hypothetical protein